MLKFLKKYIAILLCTLFIFTFTSCSSEEETSLPPISSQPQESLTPSTEPEPKPMESIPDSLSSEEVAAVSPVETDIHVDLTEIEDLDNTKYGWGQGVIKNDLNQPVGSLDYQKKFGDYDAYFIAESEPKIYITFDEGYENGYTASILDTLKEKNVSAVFFVTMPYVKSQPELVQRMIDEGHVVGSHSVAHLSFPDMELADALEDLQTLHEYVVENFDYSMTLFRFPKGEFSERTLALAQQLGYKSIFWSYAYLDYDVTAQLDKDTAFTKVTSNAHNGAIYLLHAVSKTNTEILGDVIDNFREQGFEIAKFE